MSRWMKSQRAIAELKAQNGERIWVKRLEQTKKTLEARLDKLTNAADKDDVVTFEGIGRRPAFCGRSA